jgi:DNA topoisomerase III
MLMKVVLAEKPSVAREIAQFLRAGSRHEGYFEGSGYQVTWAYGHLVTLKEPDEYDPAWKKWSLDTLPILPERFELKTVDDKLSRKQFSIVKQLFRAADEIICATDAGREGELIFRYIQTLTGCAKKPFSRLWLSSLTAKAIRDAFDKLRPGREYDDLYAAARCRSEADWIVGMNGTRNFTVRFGGSGMLWSVGRVQTPVLAMIVRRDDQIRTFRPEPFWELLTRYRETQFQFAGERFTEEAEAQQMFERVAGQPLAITKIEKRRERSQPPQLYDLTELQRDMNRRFGLSAAATLQAAQALYEAKLITYPRTDSRYLTKDMQREVPQILENLRPLRSDDIDRLDLDALAVHQPDRQRHQSGRPPRDPAHRQAADQSGRPASPGFRSGRHAFDRRILPAVRERGDHRRRPIGRRAVSSQRTSCPRSWLDRPLPPQAEGTGEQRSGAGRRLPATARIHGGGKRSARTVDPPR